MTLLHVLECFFSEFHWQQFQYQFTNSSSIKISAKESEYNKHSALSLKLCKEAWFRIFNSTALVTYSQSPEILLIPPAVQATMYQVQWK